VALAWPLASPAQIAETSVQPMPEGNWSATAGRTVGAGSSMLQAEAGWPGISFTYLKGLDERSDLGFHVGLNYGFEGTTNRVTGINLAVPYRRNLVSGDTDIDYFDAATFQRRQHVDGRSAIREVAKHLRRDGLRKG